MRKALSIAAGALSLRSDPKMLLMSKLKLMRPRLSVTGSMRRRTRRTSGFRQANSHASLNGVLRKSHVGIASWMAVPTSTPIA